MGPSGLRFGESKYNGRKHVILCVIDSHIKKLMGHITNYVCIFICHMIVIFVNLANISEVQIRGFWSDFSSLTFLLLLSSSDMRADSCQDCGAVHILQNAINCPVILQQFATYFA